MKKAYKAYAMNWMRSATAPETIVAVEMANCEAETQPQIEPQGSLSIIDQHHIVMNPFCYHPFAAGV